MQNPNPSDVLFILGMHRSGTSAITRVFNLLGYAAPKTLMKSNASNVTGHWESTPIARLNDEILAAARLKWSDWSLGRISGIRAHAKEKFEEDILQTLSLEFLHGQHAVVKDPRISRLFEIYKSALAKEHIAYSCVIQVRNPLAVAKSLNKRNGISELDAGLLWLRYVLDATQNSGEQNRVFLSYENFVADPVNRIRDVLEQLNLTTPYPLDAVKDQIASYISADLQHHSYDTIDVAHDPVTEGWISDAYQALLVLSNDPNAKHALERLSEIKLKFDQSCEILTTVSVEHKRISDDLFEEIDSVQNELNAQTESNESLEREVNRVQNELNSQTESNESLEREVNRVQNELNSQTESNESLEREVNRVQNELNSQTERNERLEHEVNRVQNELNSQTERNESLEREVNRVQNELNSQTESNERLEHEINRVETELSLNAQQKESLESQLNKLSKQNAALLTLLNQRESSIASHRAQARTADTNLSNALSKSAEWQLRFETQQEINANIEAELSRVQMQFEKVEHDLKIVNPRLKSREKELRQLERQFWRLKDELSWSKEIVNGFENSTSWRISAPLRVASRFARKIKLKFQSNTLQEIRKRPANAHNPKVEQTIGEPVQASETKQFAALHGVVSENKKATNSARNLASNISLLEQSSSFDKAYYLAHYPDAALHPDGAEGHYLLEGWRLGNRPNPTFETNAYLASHPELEASEICPLIHFIQNVRDASPKGAFGLNGASAVRHINSLGRIAVFTAISNAYDNLKEPESVSENTDYFVFTDGDVPAYSNWKPLPFEFVSHDPTRTARFVKTHPHLYFHDYDWAIWIDANLQLTTEANNLIPAEPRVADIYTWNHPLRTCVYQEAEECIQRRKDDSETIKRQIESLRTRNFPVQAGLFETSVIVSKMGSEKVKQFFNIWWREISQGSKRDQLSLPYAIEASGLNVGFLARERICMRTDPRFVYYRHSAT